MDSIYIKHATHLLNTILGDDAIFRPGQWEAISAAMKPGARLIVVQRTGWGKSLVYFIATRLNREIGRGMTIIISPLLSLMRNQIDAAHRFGLHAERIDSSNADEHDDISHRLLRNEIDILLISPERLANVQFRQQLWPFLKEHTALMVIDEVHCISDWGHDFRPNYRRVIHILNELPDSTSVLGTTATANSRVIHDIREIVGGNVQISRGPLTRESLQLYVFPEPQPATSRLVWLSHLLKRITGSGIIYCTTTHDCLVISRWLKHEGFNVEPYYSDVEDETNIDRATLEQMLLENKVKALVASVALGMGFDKPDLGFVIHYQMPGSVIGYYQQIGRAGRGIDHAYIVLMRGEEDRDIQEYFIKSAFPKAEEVETVVTFLLQNRAATKSFMLDSLNISRSLLEKILLHLEVEGLVQPSGSTFILHGEGLPDFERWSRVQQQRYAELEQMEQFAVTDDCLMLFLAEALEDTTNPQKCGRCINCRRFKSAFEPSSERIEQAAQFLRDGQPIWIEPRKQWTGRNVITEKAKLTTTNENGLALSYYNDGGYGQLVKRGKYNDGRFNDELVDAAARLIARHWNQEIKWITNVPSVRHPRLVTDFSERLAQQLTVPYRDVIECVQHYPEQKTMQNSAQQLKNISNAFHIREDVVPQSVLLVDDIIDSGWTLTLLGWHLRQRGVKKVYPFALALATGGQ